MEDGCDTTVRTPVQECVSVVASEELSVPAKAPQVSILMPCYRGVKYVEEAIQSCLDQSFRDFELICVDDKSPDGTLAFVRELARRDARIRVIARETNGGQGRAFQTALDASRGGFVTRLAQDDIFYPDALGAMLAELERHPEAGMTYCDMEQIDPEGKVLYPMVTEEPASALLPRCRVGLCVMWRREVHAKAGEFAADTYSEDYDLWLQISAHYPIVKTHGRPQLGFRKHDSQASNESRRLTESSRKAHLRYHQTLARMSPWSLGARVKVLKGHVHLLLLRARVPKTAG